MITLNSAVGIEIRGDELLLVCLKRGLRDTSVAGYKVIENFRQMQRSDLKRAVHNFFRSNRVRRENVILGVPRDKAIVRFVTLPAEVKDNLRQVMRLQVENYEPSEENGSYFDYAVLEETEGEGAKLSVVLVLVKRAHLDEYLALFKELQIPLHSVQLSTFALCNLLVSGHDGLKNEAYFIFNFSQGQSELIGIRGKRLAYSGLHTLRDGTPAAAELITELENAMSASRIQAENVEKILLAGKDAESTRQLLAADIPEVGLVTSNMKLRSSVAMGPSLPNLAAPIGLALQGLRPVTSAPLNLLPEAQRLQRSRFGYLVSYALLVVLALLGVAFFGREFYQEQVYLRGLEQEIAALRPQVEEVDAIRKESQILEDKINYLRQLLCATDHNLELMSEMTTSVPDDTYLLYLSNRDGEIMLQGLSQSASALLPLLSKSKYLKGVEPQAPFTRDPVSGKERFQLKARMEALPCN